MSRSMTSDPRILQSQAQHCKTTGTNTQKRLTKEHSTQLLECLALLHLDIAIYNYPAYLQ
jgi:hypothetical protein